MCKTHSVPENGPTIFGFFFSIFSRLYISTSSIIDLRDMKFFMHHFYLIPKAYAIKIFLFRKGAPPPPIDIQI